MNANKGCLNVIDIAHFLWPQIATEKLRESGKNVPIAILNCSCITQCIQSYYLYDKVNNVYKIWLNHTILALTLLSRFTCDCQELVLDAIYVLLGRFFLQKVSCIFVFNINCKKNFQQLWRGVVAALGFEMEDIWTRNKSHRSFQLFNNIFS